MLRKLFLSVVFLIAFVKCKQEYTKVERHGVTFTADPPSGRYWLTEVSIPVLRKGSVGDFEEAVNFQINNIQLKEIEPGAFFNLPLVNYFEITDNPDLTEFKHGVVNKLTSVTKIDLSNNGLKVIEANAFDDMPKLEEIVLDSNKLQQWNPDWFHNTPVLTDVHACRNSLEEIPANAFKNFQNKDPLTIHLVKSNIRTIDDDAFKGVKAIRLLRLQENKLEELGHFLRNVQVGEVYVSENNIHCQAEGDLDTIFVANTTHIGQNPWDKKCLKKVREWWQLHDQIILTEGLSEED